MKDLILKGAFVRLTLSVMILITGAYLFVTTGGSKVSEFLLVAGVIGHIYFLLTYFLMRKKE